MKVYFVRHAVAELREEWEKDDDLRPLTSKGKSQMKKFARKLAKMNVTVDVILTSPLVRAKQTAEILSKGLKVENEVLEEPRLKPGFGDTQFREILADHAGSEAIMLVGHEPDFSLAIGQLIGGGRIICKKGSAALVDIEDIANPAGELEWLIPPKVAKN